MSSTAEKEIEVVAGVIEGVTQKRPDTWQVAVKPDGSNFARNLWTKDAELVSALSAKLGQAGAFVCSASYWEKDGKQIRSLWINAEGTEAAESVQARSTPGAAVQDGTKPSSDGMTKEEWARKDSAIHKMACIKTAADTLKHTIPSDPSAEELSKFMARVATLSSAWHSSVLAERDDPAGDNIPF